MANGIVIRPSVGQADIDSLRDASAKMQAIAGTDNRSWIYWAEYHGFNRYDCWHGANTGFPPGSDYPYDLFLPWHRAYLMFWNHALRDQNENAVQPWWDWSSPGSHQVGIPPVYAQDGGNPLASGPKPPMPPNPAGETQRAPSDPSDLPTAAEVTAALALSSFRDFSDQVQQLHNRVHGWVGGDMGIVATSAFDPIFWAHHTMIDRLWYLWQVQWGVNNIPSIYLDKALFPGYTVQQVLDIHVLGYEYASGETVTAPVAVPDEKGGDTPTPVTSEPIDAETLDTNFNRADIEFHGVDHSGPSYEGRVYVNNPGADEGTGKDPEVGYAGSFHVFGHGGCLGDPGHCEVKPRHRYDPRPGHHLTPDRQVVIATDAVRRALDSGDGVTVTVVPIVEPLRLESTEEVRGDVLRLDHIKIVTYR